MSTDTAKVINLDNARLVKQILLYWVLLLFPDDFGEKIDSELRQIIRIIFGNKEITINEGLCVIRLIEDNSQTELRIEDKSDDAQGRIKSLGTLVENAQKINRRFKKVKVIAGKNTVTFFLPKDVHSQTR